MKGLPTLPEVIQKYLRKDFERFLKRLYRQNRDELIFSKTLKVWKEQHLDIYQYLKSNFQKEYPVEICYLINVHKVMCQHYYFEMDLEDFKRSQRIADVTFYSFKEYLTKRLNQNHRDGIYISPKHNRLEARQELLARGFVKQRKIKNFDRKYAWITSNNNISGSQLVYPIPMTVGVIKGTKWFKIPNAYMVHGLIGITGFTRILTNSVR